MPKGKRWCFLANYRDRSMFRNNVALSMTFNDALYPLKGKNFNNLDADLTFEEAVDRLKTVLRARIARMDELVESF